MDILGWLVWFVMTASLFMALGEFCLSIFYFLLETCYLTSHGKKVYLKDFKIKKAVLKIMILSTLGAISFLIIKNTDFGINWEMCGVNI